MTIVFFADTHLGFRQYGFAERADDFILATAFVFNRAIALKADAIVLGGDTYQSIHPPASAVYTMHTLVKQASDHGIMVYGIDGNHDAAATAWMRVCGIVPLDDRDANGMMTYCIAKDATIAGLNGAAPSVLKSRLEEFVRQHPNIRIDIFVLHTEVAEMCGYESVGMTAAEVSHILRPLGTRLVLMGHIHDYKEAEIGGVRFIYSGSPEMTAKDEQPEKSFSVIEIDQSSLKTSIYPIPTRRIFDKNIKSESELDSLLAELNSAKDAAGRLPLAMIYYDNTLTDFGKRAEALLQGRALYRLIPVSAEARIKGDIFAQMSQQTFERKGALRNLKDVLAQTFGEGSEEGALVAQMMDAPDNVPEIVLAYTKAKGLDIR